MKRRTFLAGGAASLVATAPRAANPKRLGLFSPAFMPSSNHPFIRVLLASLATRGYEGDARLVTFPRTVLGDFSSLDHVVQEFASLSLDVSVVIGHPMAAAMAKAGLPVVGAYGVGDPVATGLVTNIAHPGGTITGVFDDIALLTIKRLSILADCVPGLKTVSVLWNREDRGMTLRYQAMKPEADRLGITLRPVSVREPDDFDAALASMEEQRPDAILMIADGLTNLNRKRVIGWAERARVPAIYELDPAVQDGGLMSYGSDAAEAFERAGALAARIFDGALPGDLPFEQSTRYTFAINTRTARSMGFKFPDALLAVADKVIE